MKLYTLIILFIISNHTLFSQEWHRIIKPLVYRDLSIDALPKAIVSDKVFDGRTIIYTEIIDSNYKKQYFRINDTLYRYREYLNDIRLSEGNYSIDVNEYVKGDTIAYYQYGVYEEQLEVTTYHQLQKTGQWYEKDNNHKRISGGYKCGLRKGHWHFTTNDNVKYKLVYKINGDVSEIVKVEYPTEYYLNKFKKWLDKSEFCLCNYRGYELKEILQERNIKFLNGLQNKCKPEKRIILKRGNIKAPNDKGNKNPLFDLVNDEMVIYFGDDIFNYKVLNMSDIEVQLKFISKSSD